MVNGYTVTGSNQLFWYLPLFIIRVDSSSLAKHAKSTLFLTYIRNKMNLISLATEDGVSSEFALYLLHRSEFFSSS